MIPSIKFSFVRAVGSVVRVGAVARRLDAVPALTRVEAVIASAVVRFGIVLVVAVVAGVVVAGRITGVADFAAGAFTLAAVIVGVAKVVFPPVLVVVAVLPDDAA
ncbi:MAG: hypothetical protein O0Y03_00550 [Methanocorpusculum sp.]|nr:hypothetical protein [Methanocorpusculum sp.]